MHWFTPFWHCPAHNFSYNNVTSMSLENYSHPQMAVNLTLGPSKRHLWERSLTEEHCSSLFNSLAHKQGVCRAYSTSVRPPPPLTLNCTRYSFSPEGVVRSSSTLATSASSYNLNHTTTTTCHLDEVYMYEGMHHVESACISHSRFALTKDAVYVITIEYNCSLLQIQFSQVSLSL